jgi:hypothetical protein
MVSCIYFTDPAIRAVFKESIESIKRRYVYNYYCIQFLPSNDSTIDFNSQYPKLLKITPTPEHYDHTANFIKETRNRYLNQSSGEVEEPIREFRSDTQSPLSITRSLDEPDSSAAFQRKTISPAIKPELPTIRLNQVHGRPVEEVSPHYSIISVTSKNGNTFLPNESTVDLKKSPRHIDDPEHQKKTVNCLPRKSKVKTMPMRRVLDSSVLGNKVDPKGSQTEPHDRASFSKHNETVKTLVPFRWPACAKVIHWTLTKIFRVKTIEIRESDEDNLREYQCGINGKQGEPSRIFRDFTDDSDPGSPPMPARNDSVSFHPDIDLKNTGTSSKAAAFYTHKRFSSLTFDDTSGDEDAASNSVTTTRKDRLTSASSLYNIKQAHSSSIGEKESAHPLRRVSSINIGSLQRARARKLSISTFPFNRQVVERDAEPSSPTTKFVSSIGLTKMLSRGRSMSFSWSKLTSTKGKAGPCPDTSTSALDQTSTVDSEVNNNKEVVEMTELPAESSSKMIGEPIDKDIYNDDLDNLTTDKPGSSRSRSPIPQEIAATLTPSSPAIASTPSPSPSRTEYPMQLSPRPRTQYKKPAVIGHQQRSRQGSATVINAPHFLCRTVKRISKKKKRSSVISTEDTTHMSELVHGASGSPQGPQLPIQSSFYVGEEPEEEMLTIQEQSVPVDNEQEGLSHGHTTISFISNWQDAESVENNRIIGISEAWDLDEQLRKQLEFAEQVSHI